jgi:integrase
MLNSLPRKRGRRQAFHRLPDGTEVAGLKRRGDGRWRISATGETFTEPDERLAVARFQAIVGAKESRDVLMPVEAGGLAIEEAFDKATTINVVLNFGLDGKRSVSRAVPEAEFWATVRQLILEKPKYVALMTGIEQIGYLADLPKPAPSPTLQEVGELYAKRVGLSPNEAGRSKLFWKEFVTATGLSTVREIDRDAVARYEAAVNGGDLAPKSILHRYRKLRTILAYAIKRGKGLADCRRALDVLAMLEVEDAHPLNPSPIPPDTFWKIHAAAGKADDATFAALLLTALNACMYSGEVAALKWDEVDLDRGELATARPKTKVGRIAKLWPETVKALAALPRRGDYVFNTSQRSYTTFSALEVFRRYRQAAGCDEKVKFSMIRDAAFSIACSAGSLEAARALAGHRLPGVTDYYLKRNVGFVAAACDAVRAAFLKKGALKVRR